MLRFAFLAAALLILPATVRADCQMWEEPCLMLNTCKSSAGGTCSLACASDDDTSHEIDPSGETCAGNACKSIPACPGSKGRDVWFKPKAFDTIDDDSAIKIIN